MSNQVRQLLSKALSTHSEEEAVACLRMARRKSAGQTVDIGGSNTTETNKDWKQTAEKYYRIAKNNYEQAKKQRDNAIYYGDLADKYRNRMLSAQSKLLSVESELADLKKKQKMPFGAKFFFPVVAVLILTYILVSIMVLVS